jgi:probable rRNA maturation factor
MPVKIFITDTKITLRDRERLKSFIVKTVKRLRYKLNSLSLIFCSDEFLLKINRDFLGHNYYTDIITFNYAGPAQPIEGEIYISIDRVKENAKTLSLSQKEELHRVVFHGVMHLCGLNDKTRKDKESMRAAEDACLKAYFQ